MRTTEYKNFNKSARNCEVEKKDTRVKRERRKKFRENMQPILKKPPKVSTGERCVFESSGTDRTFYEKFFE